ncbi:MAG: hydantoinase B/oxoprolinase family protein [Gammaproteobacteria bacterium]|nr:hydantoinase B/oxoprolinase family protein [Gammaproteobacteria bacterium]
MSKQPVDPITTEVITRHLLNTAEEAGVVLMRAAYSPNIKERHDCSTAIFDAQGQVVAQAHHIPIHLGSMIGAIEALTQRHPVDGMRPGDMFLANDPYTGGGSHLPDLNIIAPVFAAERLVGWVANIAHHADVGGMVAGSEAAVCENIYQEGLRLPPVRLVNAGRVQQDIVDIVLLNSRTPHERLGDLRAQIAANQSAVRGVLDLHQRYSSERVEAALEHLLDLTEQRFERALQSLRPGSYTATEHLSGDSPGELASIRLRLQIGDGRLCFDFDGTDAALQSARNIPRQAVLATLYTVAKALLDPDVPANAGYFRTIDLRAPAGSIVDPRPPAAVGCRSISCGVLCDAVVDALSQAAPQIGMAPSGPHHLLTWSGLDPRNDRYFVNYETVAGGLGALSGGGLQTSNAEGGPDYRLDGMDAVRTLASGSANLPIEALEHAYPLRVERYALRDGSGGHGRHRGGSGIVRDYRVLGDSVRVSLSAERLTEPARGLDGGGDAAVGRFVLDPGTADERELGSGTRELALRAGALLRVETPGGAGVGSPRSRDAASLARDLREQRLRVDQAREVYARSADELQASTPAASAPHSDR